MSAPAILQINANQSSLVSSLAFSSAVSKNSFLFCLAVNTQNLTISDGLNGSWTRLATGAPNGLAYTIAYFPSSAAGTVTVSLSTASFPMIVEISQSSLGNTSAVASGVIPSNSAEEITSAQIAATAGQLLLGYAFTTGKSVQSAGGSYTLQVATSQGAAPYRMALEIQTAGTGSYNSDFFTPTNVSNNDWGTGILALTAPASSPGNSSFLSAALDTGLRGLRH